MTRLLIRLASAAATAAFAAAPALAQTPVPTSPTDPLARVHGWVEAAPGSQTAKPEADTPAARPAPQPEDVKAAPELAPEAAPVAKAQSAPEPGDAATSSRARPMHSARHARAAEQPAQHREAADRRSKAGDRSADQLNRQELNKLSPVRNAAPASRP